MGDALVKASYDKEVAGGESSSPAPFATIANLFFTAMEEFGEALSAGTLILVADLPDLAKIEPVIQFNEVVA